MANRKCAICKTMVPMREMERMGAGTPDYECKDKSPCYERQTSRIFAELKKAKIMEPEDDK